MFIPFFDKWYCEKLGENEHWTLAKITNAFALQNDFFDNLKSASSINAMATLSNRVMASQYGAWSNNAPLFPTKVAIAKTPGSDIHISKETFASLANLDYNDQGLLSSLDSSENVCLSNVCITLSQHPDGRFYVHHWIGDENKIVDIETDSRNIMISWIPRDANLRFFQIMVGNSLERFFIYNDTIDNKREQIIEWIQKQIKMPQIDNVYMAYCVSTQRSGKQFAKVHHTVNKMTVDELLAFFKCGRRRGSKLDTFLDCAESVARKNNDYIRQMPPEMKKMIITTKECGNIYGVPTNTIGASAIMTLLNNAKVLSSMSQSPTDNRFLVEVTDEPCQSFANCLFSVLESSNGIVLYGHTLDQLNKVVGA